jgi:hypothetical protein
LSRNGSRALNFFGVLFENMKGSPGLAVVR